MSNLSEEQMKAVNKLVEFLADPDPSAIFFTLKGVAGSGKTFCLQEVVRRAGSGGGRFAFTAPTNKAVKVLRRFTGEACTIYSLLGLRIDKSGELKKLEEGAEVDLSHLEAIFIDEASMITAKLFQLLRKKAMSSQLKVVFIGDAAQLPPVGESLSPVWSEVTHGVELTTVIRYDNQILKLATEIRLKMELPFPSVTIASDNNKVEGVWKVTKAAFRESLYLAAAAGAFADGSQSKVIAWRNVRVAEYNHLIRSAIYGAVAETNPYIRGDRIVAAAPCMRGEETLLATDEEAVIESVLSCKHPLEPKYGAIELKAQTEGGKTIRLLVLDPVDAVLFANDSQALAHRARADGKLWKKFWEHKDLFHDTKYAYALTAHRSQGSTYQNVWVDYQDILLNQTRREAFQCLYVACTRAEKQLRLA